MGLFVEQKNRTEHLGQYLFRGLHDTLQHRFQGLAHGQLFEHLTAAAQQFFNPHAFGNITLHHKDGRAAQIVDHSRANFHCYKAAVTGHQTHRILFRRRLALQTLHGIPLHTFAVLRDNLFQKTAFCGFLKTIAQQSFTCGILIDAFTVLNHDNGVCGLFDQGTILALHIAQCGFDLTLVDIAQPTCHKHAAQQNKESKGNRDT